MGQSTRTEAGGQPCFQNVLGQRWQRWQQWLQRKQWLHAFPPLLSPPELFKLLPPTGAALTAAAWAGESALSHLTS